MAIDTAIKLASGLAGLFGGKKKSAAQRAMEKQAALQASLMEERARLAREYDPAKDDAAMLDQIDQGAARILANSQADLNQRFKVAGGSPTGDTNFKVAQRRSMDDILNEVARIKAERLGSQAARKMAALDGALAAPSGQLMATYDRLNEMDRRDLTGTQQVIGQAIDGFTGKKKDAPNGDRSPSKTADDIKTPSGTAQKNVSPTNKTPSWIKDAGYLKGLLRD